MILLIVAILSFAIALTVFFVCFNTVSKLYWIPVVFAGSYVSIALLWALSLIACTLFVNKNKPCRKHSRLYRFFANCIIDTSNILLRVKLHITGKENLPKEKFLLVGNHLSFMDPVITMGVLRSYRMGFVGASNAIFKFPIMDKLLHKNFCIPINRESTKDGVKMVNEAAEIIKSGQASVGIYPEGRRNLEGGEMLPFRNGAFKIAKKANCPIVVAVIKNVEKIKSNIPFKKTHVYLDFTAVIQPDEFADKNTQQIGEHIRGIIEQALTPTLPEQSFTA